MKKVIAKFAFYNPGYGLNEPEPSYLILSSDDPELPRGSNVGQKELLKHGVPIPLTPIWRTWVKVQNDPTIHWDKGALR
jgi:hypothetical protein